MPRQPSRHTSPHPLLDISHISKNEIFLIFLKDLKKHWPAKVISTQKPNSHYDDKIIVTLQLYNLFEKNGSKKQIKLDMNNQPRSNVLPFESVYSTLVSKSLNLINQKNQTRQNHQFQLAMMSATKDYEELMKTPEMYQKLRIQDRDMREKAKKGNQAGQKRRPNEHRNDQNNFSSTSSRRSIAIHSINSSRNQSDSSKSSSNPRSSRSNSSVYMNTSRKKKNVKEKMKSFNFTNSRQNDPKLLLGHNEIKKYHQFGTQSSIQQFSLEQNIRYKSKTKKQKQPPLKTTLSKPHKRFNGQLHHREIKETQKLKNMSSKVLDNKIKQNTNKLKQSNKMADQHKNSKSKSKVQKNQKQKTLKIQNFIGFKDNHQIKGSYRGNQSNSFSIKTRNRSRTRNISNHEITPISQRSASRQKNKSAVKQKHQIVSINSSVSKNRKTDKKHVKSNVCQNTKPVQEKRQNSRTKKPSKSFVITQKYAKTLKTQAETNQVNTDQVNTCTYQKTSMSRRSRQVRNSDQEVDNSKSIKKNQNNKSKLISKNKLRKILQKVPFQAIQLENEGQQAKAISDLSKQNQTELTNLNAQKMEQQSGCSEKVQEQCERQTQNSQLNSQFDIPFQYHPWNSSEFNYQKYRAQRNSHFCSQVNTQESSQIEKLKAEITTALKELFQIYQLDDINFHSQYSGNYLSGFFTNIDMDSKPPVNGNLQNCDSRLDISPQNYQLLVKQTPYQLEEFLNSQNNHKQTTRQTGNTNLMHRMKIEIQERTWTQANINDGTMFKNQKPEKKQIIQKPVEQSSQTASNSGHRRIRRKQKSKHLNNSIIY